MTFSRFVMVAVICGSAWAQADRGTLTGTVSDPQGAVIPQARIGLRNMSTGAQYETLTTGTGNYSVAQLPAGSYELTVEVMGFKKYTQQGIAVQVAQTGRLDVVMEVGSTTESITITADVALLKTESAEQSYNIATQRMNDLPLNFGARGPGSFRNPFTFVQLLPGANITARNNIRVNGVPNMTFGIRLEGQDTYRPLAPDSSDMIAPSVEAVQEISVQTSNFAAEYGQAAGGLFNFTTKSGTNSLHGSAYGYFVNEALHAGRPFTDDGSGNHIRPKDRKQDSGFSLGGPVRVPQLYDGRNKTFYFFNIEKYVNRGSIAGNFATLPIPEFRNGDFSATLTGRTIGTDRAGRPVLENTIFDPATSRTVNNVLVRDPFPGNRIPADRFDPVSARIQAYIPLPTRPGLFQNFQQIASTVRKNEITSVKMDHSFNERSKLSGYFQFLRTKYGNNGADGLAAPITAKRLGSVRMPTIRINYDHSILPTMILHLGAGFRREHIPDVPVPGVLEFDQAAIGLTGAVGPGFPRITGLGQGNFGGLNLGIGPTNANDYFALKPTAVTSLTWVHNNHTYKFGAEWGNDAFINRNALNTYGSYGFSNAQTQDVAVQGVALQGGTVGHGYASFLLGGPSTATIANQQDPHYRKANWTVFAQDTWKVTRRLTLDYGLRWDYQTAFREQWDRFSAFDPNRPNPVAGNRLGATSYEGYGPGRCNCRFASTYPFAFGPRLGVAYQFDSKTVIRGGFGITYGQTGNFNYLGATVGTGFNTLTLNSPAFAQPAMQFRNGLRFDQALLYASNFDPGILPRSGQIDAASPWVDPDGGRPPRVMQWSIGVQREINRNLVVDLSYVGNRGAWFQANGLIDLNALTPERIASFGLDIRNALDRTLLTSQIGSATAAARGFNRPAYPGFPTTGTVAQTLRPYPQFSGIGSRWAPLGNSWYDSLQLKVTKRYSHGLDFSFAFTWQNEFTSGAEDQGGFAVGVNDVFNRRNQKHLSLYSQPLVTVMGVNYRIAPMGPNRAVRLAVGGWTLSGVLRYASGVPIAVPGSNTSLLGSLLFRGTRMNRVAGEPLFLKDLNCHCIDPNRELVLNPRAWSDVPAGEWGVSAAYYGDYRQQRLPDEQLSVGRTFTIREGMTLHFRGEFFNAFNRAVLAFPASGNPFAAATCATPGSTSTACTGNWERRTGGFGFINPLSSGTPRNGQVVIRFQF
jgi:hypothetical protein